MKNNSLSKTVCSTLLGISLLFSGSAMGQEIVPLKPDSAQTPIQSPTADPKAPKKSNWYEKISFKGYTQIRYNRLLETNTELKTDNDKSIGNNSGFFIRRARLVFSGQVHERVYLYIQPDLASTPSGSASIHFAQLRDAYFDLSLDRKKEFRFRIGQSKVPFGFENMQSSSNRLTLDRSDALNSGVPNERDLGVMFYWAPENIRKKFSDLCNSKLKGTGDYGVFGLGIYNGQSTNKNEANNNQHVVARLSYPLTLGNQIIEPGIQAYTGTYSVTSDQLSSSVVKAGRFQDQRAAASFMLYPQPFGFQAEYNVGNSPEFDPETKTIKEKSLHGGYAMVMYNIGLKKQLLIPFVKVQYYEGGKKAETDARSATVQETEIGIEWQPIPAFELTTQYTITDRTNKDGKNLNNQMHGSFLRLQAQFNY